MGRQAAALHSSYTRCDTNRWHDVHSPLQAPDRFQYPAYFNDSYQPRLLLNAMASALDEGMRNVTDTIKAVGLWSSCLIVWSADK